MTYRYFIGEKEYTAEELKKTNFFSKRFCEVFGVREIPKEEIKEERTEKA